MYDQLILQIKYLKHLLPNTKYPRSMIKNAKNWAQARGLCNKSEVHGEDEFKIPTDSNFCFTSLKRREAEGSGSMEVDDPDGELLNFGDLNEQAAILLLGSNLFLNTFEQVHSWSTTPSPALTQARC